MSERDSDASSSRASFFKKLAASLEGASEEKIRDSVYPYFNGVAFISHSGADTQWCERYIVRFLEEKYWIKSYFFYSAASGAASLAYAILVRFVFDVASTLIFVVSERSAHSEWARREASWAIYSKHPLVICLLDGTPAHSLHPKLGRQRRLRLRNRPVAFVDFSRDPEVAEMEFQRVIQTETFKPKYKQLQEWTLSLRPHSKLRSFRLAWDRLWHRMSAFMRE